MKKITRLIFVGMSFLGNQFLIGQCPNNPDIYSFVYDSKTYEVIKENASWTEAAACAVERGGILTEINDANEQTAIFNELSIMAGITNSNTVAPDGGGGAYVWLGGNDIGTEGTWVWDGNNDNNGVQFWMGDANGSPVGGLYNNWGNEPDDFNGQDALGISLNGWPLGNAGQWNDVDVSNALYFVIEHASILNIEETKLDQLVKVFPNPVVDVVTVDVGNLSIDKVTVRNIIGQTVQMVNFKNTQTQNIDVSHLNSGVYFVEVIASNGESITKKVIK